jgi:hypothetical protein
MRIDRILTLSVFGPLRALAGPRPNESIPILMYHSVADDLDDGVHPYYRVVTSRKSFARHIQWLRSAGFRAITLTRALDLLGGNSEDEDGMEPKVVITFDDGFRDFYTQAFPVLELAGFVATVFLPSDLIGKRFINGRDCLTAAEVRALSDPSAQRSQHPVRVALGKPSTPGGVGHERNRG